MVELPDAAPPVSCSIHKHHLESSATLVVWDAFVHTWARPTSVSLGAIGRLFAEGLIVPQSGEVFDAPDEVMWQFR